VNPELSAKLPQTNVPFYFYFVVNPSYHTTHTTHNKIFYFQVLGKKVEKVMISKHLVSSPVVALSADYGWTAQMEKVMKSQAFADQVRTTTIENLKSYLLMRS